MNKILIVSASFLALAASSEVTDESHSSPTHRNPAER